VGGLDKKTDFEEKKLLERLLKEIDQSKLKLDGKIVFDEEHSFVRNSVWRAAQYQDRLGAGRHAEYKRLRGLAKQMTNSTSRPSPLRATATKPQGKCAGRAELCDGRRQEGFHHHAVQGLGEMNPTQLWKPP